MQGLSLFAGDGRPSEREDLDDGLVLLRRFVVSAPFVRELAALAARAPFRHMTTPQGGTIGSAMTNCGAVGWCSDARGYRYEARDPHTGEPWPPLPPAWRTAARAAARVAGFAAFDPDVCLVNRYAPGVGMGAHRDTDERDLAAPIVTLSLGASATFFYGPARRALARVRVHDGDALVMGGASRLVYHGIAPLSKRAAPPCERISLTFRTAR